MGKQRWKNYALWISIAAQVILIVQLIGHLTGAFDLSEATSKEIMGTIDAILGLLALLGIVSNPTKPNSGGYNL